MCVCVCVCVRVCVCRNLIPRRPQFLVWNQNKLLKIQIDLFQESRPPEIQGRTQEEGARGGGLTPEKKLFIPLCILTLFFLGVMALDNRVFSQLALKRHERKSPAQNSGLHRSEPSLTKIVESFTFSRGSYVPSLA